MTETVDTVTTLHKVVYRDRHRDDDDDDNDDDDKAMRKATIVNMTYDSLDCCLK